MKCLSVFTVIAAVVAPFNSVTAFAPPTNSKAFANNIHTFGLLRKNNMNSQQPPAAAAAVVLQKQRRSVAPVQTMLFGLGAPEIAIILIAAAFLLGPQKLAELGKDAGRIAGELKEVPKEFQAGLTEGEAEAQKTKKKLMSGEPPKTTKGIIGEVAPVKESELKKSDKP